MIEAGTDRYTIREAWEALTSRFRRKPELVEPEVLPAAQPAWLPTTDIERAVYAALILAGQPVNNRRLAELMGCSPGEAFRRVAQLEGAIRRHRKGCEVMISLN